MQRRPVGIGQVIALVVSHQMDDRAVGKRCRFRTSRSFLTQALKLDMAPLYDRTGTRINVRGSARNPPKLTESSGMSVLGPVWRMAERVGFGPRRTLWIL